VVTGNVALAPFAMSASSMTLFFLDLAIFLFSSPLLSRVKFLLLEAHRLKADGAVARLKPTKVHFVAPIGIK